MRRAVGWKESAGGGRPTVLKLAGNDLLLLQQELDWWAVSYVLILCLSLSPFYLPSLWETAWYDLNSAGWAVKPQSKQIKLVYICTQACSMPCFKHKSLNMLKNHPLRKVILYQWLLADCYCMPTMCSCFTINKFSLFGYCQIKPMIKHQMSGLMTKPTKWLCAQRRLRSAWAFAQSDQSLRFALSG